MHGNPDFSFEEKYWKKSIPIVIGIDEVGRGSLAGPVVAGAAVLKQQLSLRGVQITSGRRGNLYYKDCFSASRRIAMTKKLILKLGIDDSKRLSHKQREELVPEIEKYFYTATGEASVLEINKLGIVKATGLAMKRAVTRLQKENFFILVDGYPVKGLPGGLKKLEAIIKGDQKSISIAAASIVAKVYRDKLMGEMSLKYEKYNFARNKGYGTLKHRIALRNYGQCEQHRLLFVDSLI